MALMSVTNVELQYTSIGLYIVSVLFFLICVTNNLWVLKQIRWEDVLMLMNFIFYTITLGIINASGYFATNLFPDDQLESILANPKDVHDRIIGSVLVILQEQVMLLTLWGVKICAMGFIYRLTYQMPTIRSVLTCIAAYTIAGFTVIEICFYAVLCTPFNQYWALPVQNQQCATYTTYYQIYMIFNLSSDTLIMAVASSIVYHSRLPLKQRILLMGLFCMGIFTEVAATLSKVYKFTSPETGIYLFWYVVETSAAMWICNIICCLQLLERLSHGRSFDNTQPSHSIRDPNEGREHSEPGRNTEPAWWSRLIAKMKSRKVEREAEQDYEMNLHLRSSASGVMHHHTTTESRDETITIQSLARDLDAGPALAYRQAHRIE